jgi:hypothetical protein
MHDAEDLTGRTFGQWLVLNRAANRGRRMQWSCECSCGTRRTVLSQHLRGGKSTCCGCISNCKKSPYESLYLYVVKGAARRGLPCTISYEAFVEFTKVDTCSYCAAPITWAKFFRAKHGQNYNLDRKDNSRGYVPGNLVVACMCCNFARGNRYSFDEWTVMASALKNYRGGAV